jgi:anti-sigma B factor antagonist
MSMNVKIRHVEGVTVLDLSGKITLGDGSIALREAVRDALAAGSKKILINLADVNYIDSAGLGELVGSYTSVKNAGGELKLLQLSKKVRDLLVITKLLTVFDVKDEEKEAVAAFNK